MSDDRGTVAGALMIVSGALTTLAAAGLFFGLVWVCGVGVLWLPALAIGLAEIAVGAAIIGRPPAASVRTVSVLGIVASLMCGNLLGVGLEILALVVAARPEPRMLRG
jgi:hypothetical protein